MSVQYDGTELDVSHCHTIVIDGVKFAVDLLRQMIPESGERTWEITDEDGSVQRGKFSRDGCIVLITRAG